MQPLLFGSQIIKPVLEQLNCYSLPALSLLVTTAVMESGINILPDKPKKDRFGIYQISSDMHQAAWDKELVHHPDAASLVRGLASQHNFLKSPDSELVGNLPYATAITWFYYCLGQNKALRFLSSQQAATLWNVKFHNGDASSQLPRFTDHFEQFLLQKDLAA